MNDARQLRSETLARGWAGAVEALSSVVRDTMLRLRGPQDPVQPYLQRWAAGFDRLVPPELQLFVYLPFAHSEEMADQERSVELVRRLGEPHLSHAMHHRDIIKRFGRFPHRNPILGRTTTAEEQAFLDSGGFAG